MVKSNFTLNMNKSKLGENLKYMQDRLGFVVLMYANTQSPQLEYYMKMNRPWTDRSGFAKAFLSSRVTMPSKDIIRITLAHGMEYGIWLELAHEKNYAIIEPTIRLKSPEIIKGFNGILRKILMGA